MNAAMKASADFLVKDLGLADWGRKEIKIAETEMPGLMAIRHEYAAEQPLRGARIAGSLHMTIQTAVLIETLNALGAQVRWASCNIYSTQDHAAAAIAAGGTPVFAVKGETLAEYWDYTHRIFEWPDGGALQHDPGRRRRCDAAAASRRQGGEGCIAHRRARQRGGAIPVRRHQGEAQNRSQVVFDPARQDQGRDRRDHHRRQAPVSDGEGRASGVSGLQRQRFGHQVEVRQSIRLPRIPGRCHQARHRCHDRRQSRGGCGYGDVGKGSAQALRALSAQVWVTEIDPICALQASMEGYRVVTMDYAADKADIFVSATGNFHVITHEHMKRMKDQAIVCNIGHFDNEIEVAALRQYTWDNIKPQVDHVIFPDGKRIILLAEGRLVNLGCGTGHPSYVMSSSFANQVLAQIELFAQTAKYPVGVYVLPKHLDEKVARLQLSKLGAQLTELTDVQARYIGVTKQGPYKADQYRY